MFAFFFILIINWLWKMLHRCWSHEGWLTIIVKFSSGIKFYFYNQCLFNKYCPPIVLILRTNWHLTLKKKSGWNVRIATRWSCCLISSHEIGPAVTQSLFSKVGLSVCFCHFPFRLVYFPTTNINTVYSSHRQWIQQFVQRWKWTWKNLVEGC